MTAFPPLSRRAPIAFLVAILAIAAGLRLLGVTFGLPAVYNPDEVAIMSRALGFAKGDLNPHNFLYPTFYFYVLFIWIGLSFGVMWVTGIVSSLSAFQTLFFTDPTNIYLAGRVLGVVCGVAGVAATYALGKRVGSSEMGLTAALFLAVAPTHVRDSHYVKHDVPVTLAIAIAQLAILRLLTVADSATPAAADAPAAPATRRALIIAAAACGVAFSTHYYAVFLALPLALAIVWREPRPSLVDSIRDLLIAGVITAVVFFALSPFLLLEPRTAWHDIIANRQIVVDRAATASHGAFSSAGAYARMLWEEAIGWPILIAAIGGLAWLVRDRWRVAIVLSAFPIAFLAFISNTVAASRYLNPVLPTLCVLAAVGLWRLLGRRPWLAVAAALLCAVPGTLLSVRLGLFFRQDDTRTIAQRFIEQQIPAGSTVLLQPYSVPLAQSRDSLREALTVHVGDPAKASTKFALRLKAEPYPAPAYRTLFLGDGGLDQDKIYVSYRDVAEDRAGEALRVAGVRFLVLKQYNVPDPAVAPLRAWLALHGRRLATFSPYLAAADASARARVAPFLHNTDTPFDPVLERPGPGIDVWQVD